MTQNPVVLSPASSIQAITWAIRSYRYPTTIIVGSSKEEFINALTLETQPLPETRKVEAAEEISEPALQDPTSEHVAHPILRKSLLQTAISRHIRIIFTPSATHLRAWLATFSPSSSKVKPPPIASIATPAPPALLVYGLVELHKDSSEWSAQGIGETVATLIDASAKHGFQAVVIEPVRYDGVEDWLDVNVPLLKGTTMKEDGTYGGRHVKLEVVLGRWFNFEQGPWQQH